MSTLSTHVLDTGLGRPAAGIPVRVEGEGRVLGSLATDPDGRARPADLELAPGRYRLVFEVAEYFRSTGRNSLYPEITILFDVAEGAGHYHLPLLLSPFGYTTYQGS